MADFPPLECTKIVYRTVFRKEWIRKDGSFKWQMFKPYRNDQIGVSVFIEPKDIEEHPETPCFGVASVHVGKVRDCSNNEFTLDVVQDKTWHGNITGIPFHYLENDLEDTEIAERMRDCCEALRDNASRPYNP
jgi:hypothetical protein